MTQQVAEDLRIVMLQQQRLNSQLQLLMTTSNPSATIHDPDSSHQSILSPLPLPNSLPPLSSHQPTPIQPSSSASNVNTIPIDSSRKKQKRKAKWVSYDPSS